MNVMIDVYNMIIVMDAKRLRLNAAPGTNLSRNRGDYCIGGLVHPHSF
jgi:hypothetical protein